MTDEKTKTDKGVLYPTRVEPDGKIHGVMAEPGASPQPGVFVPLKEGQPIMGPTVRLSPRDPFPTLNVEREELEGESDTEPTEGFGKTWGSTSEYRDGWDRIWGPKNTPEA